MNDGLFAVLGLFIAVGLPVIFIVLIDVFWFPRSSASKAKDVQK